MKVCQLCAVDFTLDKFLVPLIDGMESKGWEVISVCTNGPAIDGLREQGYKINTIHISRSLNPVKHFFSILKLVKFFHHEKFDLVHVHTPVAALIGRIAAKISFIPFVVYTAHGFYFHDDMPIWKKRTFIALEQLAGWFTDLLFTQSEEDSLAAINYNIVDKENIFAIGNGVDVERFNPDNFLRRSELRSCFNIPNDSYVVGMIGRLVKEKGVVEFLQAATILGENNLNVYFILTGSRLSSDHSAGVEESIANAKAVLGERLILTGLRENVPEILAVMDLFCLPSWREGMPRTIIEAMMMGKPVVATDIRGSREEVINEITGILVPVKSTNMLAEAIQRCISRPEWSNKLGRMGRKRALQLYDEKQIVSFQIEKIRQFYFSSKKRRV